MKHTPGPWIACKLAAPAYAPEFGIFRDDQNGAAALARTMNENSEGNAALIAAAPELLDALRALLAFFEQFDGPRTFAEINHPAKSEALALLARLTP